MPTLPWWLEYFIWVGFGMHTPIWKIVSEHFSVFSFSFLFFLFFFLSFLNVVIAIAIGMQHPFFSVFRILYILMDQLLVLHSLALFFIGICWPIIFPQTRYRLQVQVWVQVQGLIEVQVLVYQDWSGLNQIAAKNSYHINSHGQFRVYQDLNGLHQLSANNACHINSGTQFTLVIHLKIWQIPFFARSAKCPAQVLSLINRT